MNQFKGKTLLITGCTGSLGKAILKYFHTVTPDDLAEKIICFSRDELKQFEMRGKFPEHPEGIMRYFIGDIRDKDRLMSAFKEVDIVIHAAALKHVSTGQYNPQEMVKTNILGTQNVIDAAIENNVNKILFISSDKAVEAKNLYGGSKFVAEGLFLTANSYVGAGDSKFSVVRYGNVWNSRGGVIDIWNKQAPKGEIFITKPYATRFIITLDQAVEFIVKSIGKMKGLEIFIPPGLPAVDMSHVGAVYGKIYKCKITEIPIRQGEKINEKLEEGYTSDKARKLTLKEIEALILQS